MQYTISTVTNQDMLEDAFDIRRRVFVDEQQVPEDLELDDYDAAPETLHILATNHDGTPMGTARMRPYHDPSVGKIERVAVLSAERGSGLGRGLMEYIEAEAHRKGFHELRLNAQMHALGFYERLGYEAYGEPFDEAGIEHIAMRKSLR